MSLSRDELHQVALLANSYNRLPNLVDCYRMCDRDDCLRVLGDIWTVCDNIGEHKADLRRILPRSTEPLMMTAEELAELEALPDPLTVYRGADRGVNERGLSWSLAGMLRHASRSLAATAQGTRCSSPHASASGASPR